MTAPPIPMAFDGVDAFRIPSNFARIARQHFGGGEVVPMAPYEERSIRSHNHFFACVAEAWKNLPEELATRHPTPDALRKFALIQTGYFDATVYPCQFKTEARRLQAALEGGDDFAVILVDGKTVTRLTAKSQSMRAMGARTFQQSKTDVLEYVATLIGVQAQQLSTAAQGGVGANNPHAEAA